MVSIRSILTSAALLAVAVAQTPKIAFTSVPAAVVAGNTYNVTWGGGDGTPVTLTLRQGDPDNLDTVDTLASRVTADYFLWTVNTDLPTASDYALQITQGQSDINYSGEFALVGGSGTSSISYSGAASRTANSTITTHAMTTTASTSASVGTGASIARNTTFSSQSLTATSRPTLTSSGNTASSSAAQTTGAPNSNAGASMGSSAALVMGLFGAIVFLQ